MYFISKGDCVVNVVDQENKEHIAVSLLTEGDLFGEIAMIYKCIRTATVISRNYNTMARISYGRYREFINEFPIFQVMLKKNVLQYDDPWLKFLTNAIFQIFYYNQNMNKDTLFDLIFNM